MEKLRREKVWDVVSGTNPNPVPPAPQNLSASVIYPPTAISTSTASSMHHDPWHVHDGKVHSIISEHLNDSNALTYAGSGTSQEMFEHIMKKYEGTNIGINDFYTFANMMGCKYDDQASIKDHISSMAANAQKLAAMKCTLDDKFLAFLLLYSLPPTPLWEAFKSSILNSFPTSAKLTFDNVSDQLAAEITCT